MSRVKRTFFALVCVLAAASADAQKLAVRSFRVADGLAHGVIISLHQDVKGYLWLATYEGVSRFDGYQFTNYGTRDGLGHFVVNDIASDRRGNVWVAMNGAGVARLLDEPASQARKFATLRVERDERHAANAVNRILFDKQNRLWCVTDAGLYRAREIEVTDGGFERVVEGVPPYFNNAAFSDSRGRLWFSVGPHVIEVDGDQVHRSLPAGDTAAARAPLAPSNDIGAIGEDDRGHILAADTTGIYELNDVDAPERRAWRRWPLQLPPSSGIRAIVPASDGGLWIGTNAGLLRYHAGASTLYTTDNGLSSNQIRSLLRDREGTLWIGTEGSGVSRLANDRAISFTTQQGLPSAEVHHLTEDRDGRIHALVGCAPRQLVMIAGEQVRKTPSVPLDPSECFKSHLLRDALGNTWYHTKAHVAQDVSGRWWMHSARGLELSRGPGLDLVSTRLVGAADGFPERSYTEMYHDASGQVWVVNGITGNLYVANAREPQPRFRLVTSGLERAELLLRDRRGVLWIASADRIWRWANDTLTVLNPREGLPVVEPRALYEDPAGRIWIGLRYHGVSMTANPEAAEPRFVNYTTAQGLASDTVWSIAADASGRTYLGTGRGLDQLDVATGRIRHFTADDGVIGSVIHHILEDRRGDLWIASDEGIGRIDVRAPQSGKQPPVFISRVQIAGEDWPLPPTGAEEINAIELPASRNNLFIQFVGLSYRSDNLLRYQYRLEGVEENWRPAAAQREVNFARLAPGRYRFVVRAVGGDDVVSARPASIEFRILPPLYLRPWFIALLVLAIGGSGYAIYWYRVSRLVELERIRLRIAGDLHDDIGANLTKISVLSEVARRQQTSAEDEQSPLASIARISRESVAAMSDIVWAVNPRRDSLGDVVRRMRLHAEETALTRDIALDFVVPDEELVKLDLHVRRDLYLIFKEAVNNAARHSGCTHLSVRLVRDRDRLELVVRDNGRGFDPLVILDGNGVVNMRRRASSHGGRLEIESDPASGTTVRFAVAL
jgi:ligand-binding sensor domain-containing protein/two-component sensor histidine kinase